MTYLDFLPGRWLRRRPSTPGLYAMRYRGADVIINRFDPSTAEPTQAQLDAFVLHHTAMHDPEFFYAPDDAPGHPTRADDPGRYAEARARGWRVTRGSSGSA